MRRTVAVALALAAVAAGAGCGQSPEDQARSAGEDVGGDLYTVLNAGSAEQSGAALDSIRASVKDVQGALPASVRSEVQGIAAQLRTGIQDAQDRAGRQAALLDARSQLNLLVSDTNSVVNEFRRGVREGYQDAAG
jgi:hypothetical protein